MVVLGRHLFPPPPDQNPGSAPPPVPPLPSAAAAPAGPDDPVYPDEPDLPGGPARPDEADPPVYPDEPGRGNGRGLPRGGDDDAAARAAEEPASPDAPVVLGDDAGGEDQPPTRRHRSMRHLPFAVLLAAGVALRAITAYAYRPAFEFYGDSYAYLRLSTLKAPDPMRPAGYPAFLRLLSFTDDLWWVTVVQHAAGLALGVTLYVMLVHRRIAAPVAALAAAPVLLDAYKLVIEHYVMAETLFAVLLVAAIVALTWSPRPSVWACGLAGLLLAGAGLVRTIGVAIAVLVVGYLLLRRVGWLRFATFAVTLAVPLVAYASWFHESHGKYALTGGDAVWMYGRVAPIADCDRLHLSRPQLVLCSPHPPAERPDPSYYVWSVNSPSRRLHVPADERDALLRDFTHQVIRYQFGDYVRMVGGELVHYFRPGRPIGHRDWPDATWRFPTGDEPRFLHNAEPLLGLHGDTPKREIHGSTAGFLHRYQHDGFTPGPVLAAMLLLAVVAIAVPARRRVPRLGVRGARARRRWRDQTTEHRRLRADTALLAAAGIVVLVVPAATVCFDYRYLLPVLVLFPPAAALGTRRLVLVRRSRRAPDEISRTSLWAPVAPQPVMIGPSPAGGSSPTGPSLPGPSLPGPSLTAPPPPPEASTRGAAARRRHRR
ncbi:hypothetical protein [Candidatus Frankia alpina]|uniref:Glycosyltransferase RgtA/B/C/D-like domain-containing protein n=1 Tax=Candidatus Frankia alpina TaxID=2699483 RepID=A0A4S5ER97_9ACTN|nr:hypothetical protein [Candidatus Frankia alpina]THJ74683.1 hypothetical protein E7Y31_09975 [Candidatus Frankia alpina]